MTTSGNTIINIPPDFTGRVVVNHVTGSTTVMADNPTPAPAPEPAPAPASGAPAYFAPGVEDLLKRHKRHDPHTRSREMAEAMRDRGWEAHEHKRYVRFVFTGSDTEVTLYMNSKDFTMKTNELVLKDQPGTHTSGSGRRIPFAGDAFDQALTVIEFLEGVANG